MPEVWLGPSFVGWQVDIETIDVPESLKLLWPTFTGIPIQNSPHLVNRGIISKCKTRLSPFGAHRYKKKMQKYTKFKTGKSPIWTDWARFEKERKSKHTITTNNIEKSETIKNENILHL